MNEEFINDICKTIFLNKFFTFLVGQENVAEVAV